ncbi:MAG: AI-2E family transporter [Bacteroidia bacterium]|nr:AI-2E family transporter [Bacteroidia bacterium]
MKLSTPLQIAAFIVLTGVILWFGKLFLIPIAYAFLTALVLYPMCKYLESKGFGRSLSIALPILMVCLLFGGLVALLSYEMAIISGKWPLLQQQFGPFLDKLHAQLNREFGWTTEEQINWARKNLETLSQNTGIFMQETAKAAFEALFNLIIIPIYVSLLLVYRGRLVRFLTEMMPEAHRLRLPAILNDTVKVFSRFIRGMVVVYLTVGLLNSLGLWMIGVENPFLYGMFTSIMTIIPYFGIIISALLPVMLSWLQTGSLWQPLGVVIVFAVVQYLEANLIFPYVVGRYVNLNTLAAIVAIFLGALFWGVAGMILFLPFLAVFRIFADHFPELKPLSGLLGN